MGLNSYKSEEEDGSFTEGFLFPSLLYFFPISTVNARESFIYVQLLNRIVQLPICTLSSLVTNKNSTHIKWTNLKLFS